MSATQVQTSRLTHSFCAWILLERSSMRSSSRMSSSLSLIPSSNLIFSLAYFFLHEQTSQFLLSSQIDENPDMAYL